MKSQLILPFLLAASIASASQLRVEIPSGRADSKWSAADAAVRKFSKNLAQLTRKERRGQTGLFSLPVSVILTRNGISVPPPPSTRGRDPDLTIDFDSSPSGQFPAGYQSLLQQVFDSVKPRLNATFGSPFIGGTVRVVNYDAQIGERDAVGGGYYVYDGSSTPSQMIRFPYYADSVGIKAETAAVNFVHTLLLAHMGSRPLPNDAWREGLVRAATMAICRTPGALPASLDSNAIEQVLDSTYDLSPTYDWCNQKGLVGRDFIAPNLKSAALPIGGSTGGLYLVRYQMAGTAFEKILVQYPTFAAEVMSRYYVTPTASLDTLAQTALDAAAGVSATTVEGRSWSDWSLRQHILDSRLVPGLRLMVKPFAIESGLAGSDFGVFGIESHLFKVDTSGNETLLSDTGYPAYWSPDFTRIFASAQDDRLDYSLGYGSVAPNFIDAFGGDPYRVTVDVPAQDEVLRVFLPAGAVATTANPISNNFYGCISGVLTQAGTSYSVRLTWPSGSVTIPAKNYAFGAMVTGNWLSAQRNVQCEVLRVTADATTPIYSQIVNKGPGALALNLHVDADKTISLGNLPAGINLVGMPGIPRSSFAASFTGGSPGNTLMARWNSLLGKYDYSPGVGVGTTGQGYFLRTNGVTDFTYPALSYGKMPISVKLRPGWNLVANPLEESVPQSAMQVTVASGFVSSFADAATAQSVGAVLFGFSRGSADPISGVPEIGSMLPVTTLAPGATAFVRVLAPEGALLIFPPAEFRSRSGGSPPPPDYLLKVTITGGGTEAYGELGAQRGATSGFDKGKDIELPPSSGGLQVGWMGVKRLFREMRPTGQVSIYNMNLEGLKVGTTYTVNLNPTIGTRNLRVFDGSRPGPLLPGQGTFSFKANSTSKRYRIVVAKS
ncbi:MAG: hypothetical protein K8R88_03925 [Armatimonadetes bacterium]|nr:hypothetical protein [Armatimonadota bacterium]